MLKSKKMRKSIFITTLAIFAVSISVLAGPIITKNTTHQQDSKHVVKTDSTTVIDFDGYNTVNIDFHKASKNVIVKMYKNEELVYTDMDCVEMGTTLSYDIKDEQSDENFDVVVEIDGRTDAAKTVTITD